VVAALIFNRVRPVARERYEQDSATELINNRYRRNKRNRYLQDRELMKTANFSGMGDHYAVHDAFAAETPGAIHDRSREHLGSTDLCIVAARVQLLAAIASVQAGRDPIHVIRDPAKNDISRIVVVSEVIGPDIHHRDVWKSKVQKPQSGTE
jgi:phthalate 4,5-dioxygenase